MASDFDRIAARAAPAIFVVLWSTGFIATKYALTGAEPLTYLAIRMVIVVGLMAGIAAVARPNWPDRMGVVQMQRLPLVITCCRAATAFCNEIV